MYIYDSVYAQTQGPFTISTYPISAIIAPSELLRLLPVYNATQPNAPQFLVLNIHDTYASSPSVIAIDIREVNQPSLSWVDFSLPSNMPVGTSLEPSCRTQKANKRLALAGIVSGIFGIAMVAFFVAWQRRRRSSKKSKADQNYPQTAMNQERELTSRSKDAQAPIRFDTLP